jgi:type VI secretion system protein ImpC
MRFTPDLVWTVLMPNIRLDSDPATRPGPFKARRESRPFRIAILGDFSGRSTRLAAMRPKLSGVIPVSVDAGNFEEVMERMGIEVRLGENGEAPALRFSTIDDFHPDEIYGRASIFHAVRTARKELKDPAAFAAVRAVAMPAPAPAYPMPAAPLPPGGSLLDAIVDATAAPVESKPRDLWKEAIQRIVAPHSVPKPDPQQEEVRAQLDSVASEMMRIILGQADFQSIEAAWRSVFLLLRHLETNENLSIELIDVSREELLADVLSAPDIRSTGLWRLLVDEARGLAGAVPWSVSAGLYAFGGSTRDFAALERIAEIAEAARAPFIAEAQSRLAGCESVAAAPDPDDWKLSLDPALATGWQRLRSLPEARWVGLAMPRFLLRLPYGASSSSIDSFDFEEMPVPCHDAYLWGNPAVACVCLLGETFQMQGAGMRLGFVSQLEGVPIHCCRPHEETPPAEIWMTERFAESLLDRGLMPLASVKNAEAVQFISFRSIAAPSWPLMGPWNTDE